MWFYLSYMKYIITEEQYERVVDNLSRLWILRRYPLIKDLFFETLKSLDPCIFDSFEEYERVFYRIVTYSIDERYHLIRDLNFTGVLDVVEELKNMFDDDLTEHYHLHKEHC